MLSSTKICFHTKITVENVLMCWTHVACLHCCFYFMQLQIANKQELFFFIIFPSCSSRVSLSLSLAHSCSQKFHFKYENLFLLNGKTAAQQTYTAQEGNINTRPTFILGYICMRNIITRKFFVARNCSQYKMTDRQQNSNKRV